MRCPRCGKFMNQWDKLVGGSDPATGSMTMMSLSTHYCNQPRNKDGKFAKHGLIDKMKPLQVSYNLLKAKLETYGNYPNEKPCSTEDNI